MKKLTKLLAVICALIMILSLAACGEPEVDKNGETTPASQEEVQNSEEGGEDVKAADNSAIVGSWEYADGGFTYTFNEDGSGTYDTGSTVMKFTYEVTDKELSILYEGNTEPTVLEYSIDGSKLNVKDSFGDDTIYNKK